MNKYVLCMYKDCACNSNNSDGGGCYSGRLKRIGNKWLCWRATFQRLYRHKDFSRISPKNLAVMIPFLVPGLTHSNQSHPITLTSITTSSSRRICLSCRRPPAPPKLSSSPWKRETYSLQRIRKTHPTLVSHHLLPRKCPVLPYLR